MPGSSTWRWAARVTAILAAAYLLYQLRAVLPPFVLAIVIAYVLLPLVDALSRRGLSRSTSILLIYGAGALITVLVGIFVAPLFWEELEKLVNSMPEIAQQLKNIASQVQRQRAQTAMPATIQEAINTGIERVDKLIQVATYRIVEDVVTVIPRLASLIVSPVLAFYILRDLPRIKQQYAAYIRKYLGDKVINIAAEIDEVLGGFIRGQLIVGSIVGLLVATALSLLGIPFAVILGAFAGLMDLIPYFGPIIGAVPAILLALTVSPLQVLKVAAVFVIVQQIESAVISPRIISQRVGLHPITVIFALMTGGYLFGFWGLLLSVPIAGIAKVILNHVDNANERKV